MTAIRQYKSIHVTLLAFFMIFILNDVCFAKEKFPKLVKIKIKMDVNVKVKKIKKNIVPLEIKIKNRTYKIKKEHGKYGFKLKPRDMIRLSPDFKNKLATSVSVLGLYRVQQLVKKDKKKAPEVIKLHKQLKLKKAAIQADEQNKIARQIKKVFHALSSFVVTDAHAADTAVLFANAGASVDRQYMSQMSSAYNKVLNSQSFVYPIVQPGRGGWDLLNEEEGGGGTSDDADEEGDKTWFDKLLDVFFAVVVFVAPIAAIVFLCTNPLTIASVLVSLAIANGAVTGAGIIATTFSTLGGLMNGDPLYEVIDSTTFSTDGSFGGTNAGSSFP